MPNIAHLQHSDNPLERAAYWAITASWISGDLFEQAQSDGKLLQEIARNLEGVRDILEENGEDVNVDWVKVQIDRMLGREEN